MKRFGIIALCAIIAISLLFTSCKKEQEGVYNPKKKIERIYKEIQSQSYNVPKHLCEEWNWNGDKLNTITYYGDDGAQFETAKFSYDGNRISRISLSEVGTQGEPYYSFVYQNDLVSSIQFFDNGEFWGEFQITHTGNKITRIVYYEDSEMKGQISHISPLRFILPNMKMEDAQIKCFENKKSEGLAIGYTFELEWDGENISKVKLCVDDYNDYNEQYEYSYDTKMNPFYGSFLGIHENGDGFFSDGTIVPWVTSKNNIVTLSCTGWYLTNIYSYNGKYPITCTMEESSGAYREVSYYEYQ